MFRLSVILLTCVSAWGARLHIQPGPEVEFPLRNIRRSIDLEANATYAAEFRQRYRGSSGYILNLPRLRLKQPLNPFPGFIDSPDVTAVGLRENEITQVAPGAFAGLPRLEYLDLSGNHLGFCDFFGFGASAGNLRILVLEDNRVPAGGSLSREISRASCFPRLQALYLRRNQIRRLGFSLLRSFPGLVALDLADNEIDDWTFVLEVPETLSHLHVERNRLTSGVMPPNLRSLHADGNLVAALNYRNSIGSSLRLEGAAGLEILSLKRNRISHVEVDAFQDSRRLVRLDLSGNDLGILEPATLAGLRDLAFLGLDDNRLCALPNLAGNWNLETLSLRNNRLVQLHRGRLSNLRGLRKLFLGDNRIRTIDCDALADLGALEELDLSGNLLESLPRDWMKSLVKLRQLDLRRNKFFRVHQLSLSRSASLLDLHLEGNMLAAADRAVVREQYPKTRIYVDNCNRNCTFEPRPVYWHLNYETKTNYSHNFTYFNKSRLFLGNPLDQ